MFMERVREAQRVVDAAWDGGRIRVVPPHPSMVGKCTHCGAVEVELDGVQFRKSIAGHPAYPHGFGCEVCS